MKAILACDADEKHLRFPYMAFPKIDGVRALNVYGKLLGRSGKPFKNILNTEFFSDIRFAGFDGEMIVYRVTGEGICNETTSALATIHGKIPTRWCLFDCFSEHENKEMPYQERYELLRTRFESLVKQDPSLKDRICVLPFKMIHSRLELMSVEADHIADGYEGTILRRPTGLYKFGRCTPREANFLRVKRFMDSEIVVTDILEGQHNSNEQKKTPLGYAERSTVKENMIPNGMVGTIVGRVLKSEEFRGRTILEKDAIIEVAPGRMSHAERKFYFENPEQLISKIIKFQFFPVGIKDKPRFPTFQCFRDPRDL